MSHLYKVLLIVVRTAFKVGSRNTIVNLRVFFFYSSKLLIAMWCALPHMVMRNFVTNVSKVMMFSDRSPQHEV